MRVGDGNRPLRNHAAKRHALERARGPRLHRDPLSHFDQKCCALVPETPITARREEIGVNAHCIVSAQIATPEDYREDERKHEVTIGLRPLSLPAGHLGKTSGMRAPYKTRDAFAF